MHYIKIKRIFAFTLIELIIVIAIIALLASVVVATLNPSSIFSNSRNNSRNNDLSSLKLSFARYIDDQPSSSKNYFTNFTGYNNLILDNAASCPNGINGNNLNTVSGAYNLDNTNGSSVAATLDISPLIKGGYLPNVPSDPSNNSTKYKICVDTTNKNQLVIFSPIVESNSTNIYTSLNASQSVIQAGAPTYVQSNLAESSSFSNNTMTITFPQPVTAGNLVVVAITSWASSQIPTNFPSPTDSKGGNSYGSNALVKVQTYNASDILEIWSSKIVNGGSSFSVTVGDPAASAIICITASIHEYSGLTNGVKDQSASASNSGNAPDSGNVTTTSSTELIFGALQNPDGCYPFTPSTGFTKRQDEPCDGNSTSLTTFDKTVTSTGNYKANGTFDNSQTPRWNIALVTFK